MRQAILVVIQNNAGRERISGGSLFSTDKLNHRMETFFKKIPSPVGKLILVATDQALSAVLWERDKPGQTDERYGTHASDHPVLLEAEKQLNEYFARKRQDFELELAFLEGSEFQKKVWEALLTIPFGETRTYGQIAKQIGAPDAVRAVGGAANKNPIAIIAPCHRVIGANGKLVGFGGGLPNKLILLDLEAKRYQPSLFD